MSAPPAKVSATSFAGTRRVNALPVRTPNLELDRLNLQADVRVGVGIVLAQKFGAKLVCTAKNDLVKSGARIRRPSASTLRAARDRGDVTLVGT
jgi:hypothetical protein